MIMKRFPRKDPGERKTHTFNLSRVLDSDETITAATWTVTVEEGTDPSPELLLYGAPSNTGQKASQRIAGGVSGCKYKLKCQVTTSKNDIVNAVGLLEVLSR